MQPDREASQHIPRYQLHVRRGKARNKGAPFSAAPSPTWQLDGHSIRKGVHSRKLHPLATHQRLSHGIGTCRGVIQVRVGRKAMACKEGLQQNGKTTEMD